MKKDEKAADLPRFIEVKSEDLWCERISLADGDSV